MAKAPYIIAAAVLSDSMQSRRVALVASVAAALAVLACKKEPPPTGERARAKAARAASGDPCSGAKTEGMMSWIEDDYPAALACAKAKNLPLVLDLWAPWCHTCLSMQTTVFTDK